MMNIDISKQLRALREGIHTLDEQAKALEKQLRLARGTRDIAPAAAPAPKIARAIVVPLAEKIENILRSNVATPDALASILEVPPARLAAELRRMPQVVDVGTPGAPVLSWVVGDETPAPELFALVQRLLRVRPMLFSELIRFTGAREKRVSGALVHIQRDDNLRKKLHKTAERPAHWALRGRS